MEYPIPAGLEVREAAVYGRGLFSTRDLTPAGTELLTSQPFAHVVSSTSRGSVCDSCLVSSQSLLKCSQCKYIYYCGKTCQKRDWQLHKVECKSLLAIQPHTPSDTMRLVVRVIQRKKKKNKKEKKRSEGEGCLSDFGREIDYLYSNKDSLSEEVKEELALQMMGIGKLMSSYPEYNSEAAYDVLCKVLCNTFYILDWSMNAVAAGLYLLPSLLNHSCDPNCVVVYSGLQLSLRSIKEVKSGEQLFISYTELLETRERRRLHLNRVYSFQCSCSRCLGEDERVSGLLAAAGEEVSASLLEDSIRDGLKKMDDEVIRMKKAKAWQSVIDLCQTLNSRYSSILSPLNIVMIKLHQEILEAQLELQKWPEALETAELLLKTYQHHLLKYHPSIAVHLVKVAKLRRVIATVEHLELSVRDLAQALDILVVCHGAGHPLSDEVQLLLRDSQGELVRRRSTH